jgi:hypothetical protein
MSGRPWTEDELDYLRTHFGRNRCKRIGRQINRSAAAVALKANEIGLRLLPWRRGEPPADLIEFMRQQHAAGLLDTDIARAWNAAHPDRKIERRTLCYYRRKLGLPVNETARVERRRAGQRRQMQVLRIDSPVELCRRFHRRAAVRAGWPPDTTPLELRILAVMKDGQPRCRADIAELIGQSHRPQRWWFKCKVGAQSALANLVRKGLLKRTQARIQKRPGKGNTRYEYWMPLAVLRERRRA